MPPPILLVIDELLVHIVKQQSDSKPTVELKKRIVGFLELAMRIYCRAYGLSLFLLNQSLRVIDALKNSLDNATLVTHGSYRPSLLAAHKLEHIALDPEAHFSHIFFKVHQSLETTKFYVEPPYVKENGIFRKIKTRLSR